MQNVASSLDMVISLMKEVECKENAAEQAKEEAAASGLHILARVDELNKSRNRAKETYDMRYREQYAQKEVLASELKELLFRMSGMLNKGGESLGVLDQMRIALEERLTSAIIDKEFADTEKLQKELCAQEALTNEVNQMKKVVEASERMNRNAVKISKLQEYLIDCSHVVNMLKGDEPDKSEHVNLLKELLDLEVPLNEILSSSQTSSILAPIKPRYKPQPKRAKTVDKNETPKESADSLVLSDLAKISDKVKDVNMLKEKLDYAVPLPSNKSSLEKVNECKNVVAEIAKEGRAMSSECLAVSKSTITSDNFGENPNREISDPCQFPVKDPSGGISSAPPSLSLTRPPTPHTLNHYVPSPPPSQLLQQPNFYTPAVTQPPQHHQLPPCCDYHQHRQADYFNKLKQEAVLNSTQAVHMLSEVQKMLTGWFDGIPSLDEQLVQYKA
ncbi:stress response protein NST1 [Artemisia annua]|uniref:Stress response protein NST1 n=1 Tax=Artemisia annua TaxID=35608 RepID=A0A2U1Q179_ARTAN|nr:stress response protein NST1 [Artemisia annua]